MKGFSKISPYHVKHKSRQLVDSGALEWSGACWALPTQSLLVTFFGVGGKSSNGQGWFPALCGRAGRQAGTSSGTPLFWSHTDLSKVAVCPSLQRSAE